MAKAAPGCAAWPRAGPHGAQPLDIGLQHVPFKEQERQILLREIDNLVHFDTNLLTAGILHENRKMIQGHAARRSRLCRQCVDLAKQWRVLSKICQPKICHPARRSAGGPLAIAASAAASRLAK